MTKVSYTNACSKYFKGSLNKSELEKLELGVAVARISYYDTYLEKRWRRDKIGKFIKQSHKLIEERLSQPFGENLYEGL